MKYNLTVKPGTSQEKIVQDGDNLTVWVRAKAHDGEANAAVVKLLAKYFGVSKSAVGIVRGANSKHKIVEIFN